ncbi:GyrI-like domain-containing protein [Tenacibaculum sp. ZS6-P6]|uniref:GyrI-like domain-containing protein n=1 Tax=Tenacibaculum sp. ZS6-P6 TaxID=3447503 RepID=UPI003F9C3CF2
MNKTQIDSFNIIGIKTRTTNADMQAAKDIPALWQKFMDDNIANKVENKLNNKVYAVYTNYESDYTGAYDIIIGCEVDVLGEIPENMIGIQIPNCNYEAFSVKGKLKDNIVYNKWIEIWNSTIDRKYKADFEIYPEHTNETDDTEVKIYISIN